VARRDRRHPASRPGPHCLRNTGTVLRLDRQHAPEHLELVYSASTSVTAVVPNKYGSVVVVSSSTKPDLTVRMLEALDVGDGRFTERYGAFMVMRQRDNHDGPSLSWQPELPLDRERTTRTPAEPSAVAQFLRSVMSTTPLRHRYTFDEQTRQPVDGVARRATPHYQVARCWIPSSLIMDW
jgi:hypothetical protein